MLKVLIFDVDGTLADTEDVHRAAFNAAFRDAGLGWRWSVAMYTRLLEVSGGKGRIRHYWQLADPGGAAAPGAPSIIDALLRARCCGCRTWARSTWRHCIACTPGPAYR
jgi:beta-phosphoglucomutase-like phosphatase (HAD superfamily)